MENVRLSIEVIAGPGLSTACVWSNDQSISFGRNRENDCVLSNDPSISRRHFEVFFEQGNFWIKDLNSRNGTYVNDHSVLSNQLHAGDEIRAGSTRMVLQFNLAKEDAVLPRQRVGPKVNLRVEEKTTFISSRQLHSSKVSQERIQSESFLRLFEDLPGRAVLIDNSQLTDDMKADGSKVEAIGDQCSLLFAPELATLSAVIGELNSGQAMLLNYNSGRSRLITHLRENCKSFLPVSRFLEKYQELPSELSNALLNGIDLMIVDTGKKDEVAVVFERQHAHWLAELVQ